MMTSSARNTGEWQRSQPINRPEPGEFDPHPFYNQINLCKEYAERGLQAIVKLANIELTPEKPEYAGGSWHIEGQLVSPSLLLINEPILIMNERTYLGYSHLLLEHSHVPSTGHLQQD